LSWIERHRRGLGDGVGLDSQDAAASAKDLLDHRRFRCVVEAADVQNGGVVRR
jgi:hypothetical protein